MATELFERTQVIDVDTHITEPRDVWTDRVPKKWGDRVPHIEQRNGVDLWYADGQRIGSPGGTSMAGFHDFYPATPKGYDEIHPSMYEPNARVQFMDEHGIQAQVLYSNVGGFGGGYFQGLAVNEPELAADLVRGYNDFLADFSSVAPDRLLGVMSTPFWDVDFAVREIHRSKELGHRAVNFCNQPETYGQPGLGATHWDPVWAAAQECGMPISFHIGGGDIGALNKPGEMGYRTNFGRVSALLFSDNMRCIADLTFGGVCHRFPELKFVSVESGVGWVPGVLEAFDWQWRNTLVRSEHPEYELLPSEYFRRQIYACFWFENESARHAISQYPDNILYETDYPHPTCQHPGPVTPAREPREYAADALAGLADDVVAKVLHGNAAALYGLQ